MPPASQSAATLLRRAETAYRLGIHRRRMAMSVQRGLRDAESCSFIELFNFFLKI
jgi:hypothetical protein